MDTLVDIAMRKTNGIASALDVVTQGREERACIVAERAFIYFVLSARLFCV